MIVYAGARRLRICELTHCLWSSTTSPFRHSAGNEIIHIEFYSRLPLQVGKVSALIQLSGTKKIVLTVTHSSSSFASARHP